jgi:O-antigen/teichoic acid export membrane protein
MSKVVKNVAQQGFIQLINYVFPLISVPYVSRIIGPESYGVINYATAFMSYFILLISFGFELSATRRIARNPDDSQYHTKVFSEILNARIVLFLLSLFFFIIAFTFIDPLRKNTTVSILLFAMCISNVLTPQYIYQGMQNLSIFAKANFLRGLFSTILIFLLISQQKDYIYLVAINFFLSVSISLYFFIDAKKRYNLKFSFLPLKNTFSLIWNERLIFFSTVVISFYTTTNVVILGLFDNITNVGYFTTGQSLVNISTAILSAPFSMALFPYLGSAFSQSKENGLEVARKILPFLFYIIFISCLVLFLAAPLLINLLYGDKFKNSILPMQIMAFLPLIIAMSNFFGIQVMLNLNLDKLFLKITTVCSAIGLICNIVMSNYWGFIGTSLNILVVELTVTLVMYFELRKRGLNIIKLKNFSPQSILNLSHDLIIKYFYKYLNKKTLP